MILDNNNNNDLDNDFNLTIRQVIEKYGLLHDRKHSKSLGQHFLCDRSLLNKIVSFATPFGKDDLIVEVGPGPLGLTRSIIEMTSSFMNEIICIEKDISLKPLHDNILKFLGSSRLSFMYGDALRVRLCDIAMDRRITIISNLPYNVGTQLFLNWMIFDIKIIDKMILMFQREVADRICADIGSKDYGRLSVISQVLCDVHKIFDISNMAFFPAPKVMSSVIRVIPKKDININIKKLEKITGICFQQRRKTIFSILKKHVDQGILEDTLEKTGIDKLYRPENISPKQYIELSEILF